MSPARIVDESVDEEEQSSLVDVASFDGLDRDAARRLLEPCCPGRRWASEVVSGRPYASIREVLTASDDVVSDLSWRDAAAALTALGAEVDPDSSAAHVELRRVVRSRLRATLR